MLVDWNLKQKCVVAVSGGVDSVVLLDMLSKEKPATGRLLVAHFDHGIRPNSAEDAEFVHQLSRQYDLPFRLGRGRLGPSTSEAAARQARYAFLNEVVAKEAPAELLTAHHQDDFLETVVINFCRGARRRGLASLKTGPRVLRPLLRVPKAEIVAYAEKTQLAWREDATNCQPHYLRNRIRQRIMPRITPDQRRQLLEACHQLAGANRALDSFLDDYLRRCSYRRAKQVFRRDWFNRLDHAQACEVVAAWLIENRVSDYSQNQIEYVVVKLKTLRPGKMIEAGSGLKIRLTKRCLRLEL